MLKALYGMLHLQFGITLLLLPLQLHLFHGISVTSLVANLFAILLITFVSVPLILGRMVVHLTPFEALEQGVWWLADRSLAMVFYALDLLPAGWAFSLVNVIALVCGDSVVITTYGDNAGHATEHWFDLRLAFLSCD